MNLNFNSTLTSIAVFLEQKGILTPERLVKLKYFLKFRKRLNLANPSDLNEKILWLSLYNNTECWTELADKYKVRDYIINKGLEHLLVPLYKKYNSTSEIHFQELPDSFVIKSNNGSGTVLLIEDKNKINITKTLKLLDKWLSIPFGLLSGEPHYRKISPCLIVEKFLKEPNSFSSSLIDYKIWCFNGVPSYIFTGCNRDIKKHSVSFGLYEGIEWKSCHHFMAKNFRNNIIIPKPTNLQEMFEYATILSEGFPQVRVDFYEVEGKIYFGELTFTSNGGLMKCFTQEALSLLGEKIILPNKKTL